MRETCTSSEFDSGPASCAHTASASWAYVTRRPRLRISAAKMRNSIPVRPSPRPPRSATPSLRSSETSPTTRREGLTDIIVGAKLQARNAVADGCFGADADQRGIGFGAECLKQLGPVVVGQH